MCTVGHYECTVYEILTLVCTEHTSTTSPVNGTQEYHYWHEIKSIDQVWDFRDDVCRIESGKFMKCVQLAITDVQYVQYVKCSHSEHTSTTLPIDGTQEYDYWHEDKSTDQVWDFRDCV